MGAQQPTGRDRQVEERLALLLRPGPRRVRAPADDDEEDVVDEEDGATGGSGDLVQHEGPQEVVPSESRPVPSAQPSAGRQTRPNTRWRFARPQLLVILVIIAAGALLGGWAVLRARPIAIASQPGPSVRPTMSATTGSTHDPPQQSPSASISATPTIKVHVLGAVRKPGVVTLREDARVQDALKAAGGVKKVAKLGDLNLAQPLADGQQVFVSHRSDRTEVRNPGDSGDVGGAAGSTGSGAATAPGGSGSGTLGTPSGKINLNTATLDELDQLPGIGPVTAQKIVSWRDQHTKFSSVQELQEVDGIGPKTFADLEPLVTLG